MYKRIILIISFITLNIATNITPNPANAQGYINDCKIQYHNQQLSAYKTCLQYTTKNGKHKDGNPEAQKILGDMYYWGWGESLKQDYKQAVLWYKRAAIKGNLEAKFAVGTLYEQGKGTDTDYGMALKWFKSAANNGHIGAQFNYANMLSKGAGTRKNQQRATMWYQRAANQGDGESAYNLANRYATGQGIESSTIQAYKWYLIAQKLTDNQDAQLSLEFLDENMSASDIAKARQLFKQWSPKKQ